MPVDDLTNASIYGEEISKHSITNIKKIILSKESLYDCFKAYKNNAPQFYGIDYIKTNDVNKSIIETVFPKGSVIQGNEYCVALYEIDNCSPRAFVVSSKYSVFDKTKFDNINIPKE